VCPTPPQQRICVAYASCPTVGGFRRRVAYATHMRVSPSARAAHDRTVMTPRPQVRMNTLVNHDLKCHWEEVVKKWGMLAANCADFEAAHKWALKQFVRMVPHGKYFTQHLATRHLSQFAFGHGREAEPAPQEPLRFCHCAQAPCTHNIHVHVEMPGLRAEDAGGVLHPLGDYRSVEVVEVRGLPKLVRRAIKALMCEATGQRGPWQLAKKPELVYRAKTMTLKWHGKDGKLEFKVCRGSVAARVRPPPPQQRICVAYASWPALGVPPQQRICVAYASCHHSGVPWARLGHCYRHGLPHTHRRRF